MLGLRCRGKLMDYIKAEVTRGYQLELEEERFQARREKMYMFMTIPRELERLMGYGFFQCADAFLFLFTYLPMRVAFKLFGYIAHFFSSLVRRSSMSSSSNSNTDGLFIMKPADRCDFLKLGILFISIYLFQYIDTSVPYHVIKSQSVIKLYIFFNMLEVGDRLFASFVQDTIDALLLTATEECPKNSTKSKMGLTSHIFLTIFAVLGHAIVILLQGITLSVAINADNRALLTVMMSNNFVELKGAVFKKFDKINLFQVSCSDIRERFHLCVLLLVVCLQTMREYSWEESRFWVLFPDCLMVLLAEIGVDWVKHAFITRFNEIPAEVYREYTLSMAYDLAQTKQRRAFSDHADMVGRRLGFVPLPLAVVLARILRPSISHGDIGTILLTIMGFFAIASFRTLNSIILLGKACDLIDQHIQASAASTGLLSPSHTSKPDTGPFSPSHTYTQYSQIPLGLETLAIKSEAFDGDKSRAHSPAYQYFPLHQKTQADELPDLKKILKHNQNNKRSFSASHTPRPSIGSISELPTLPPLYHDVDDTKLLPANSLVRILSLSFNEEMIANEPEHEGKEVGAKLTRKHSLGSNLVDSEDVLMQKKKEEVNETNENFNHNLLIKTEPGENENISNQSESHGSFIVIGTPDPDPDPDTSLFDATVVKLEALKNTNEGSSSDELLNSTEVERLASSIEKNLDIGSASGEAMSPSSSSTPENILSSTDVRQIRVKKKSITGWFKELGSGSSSQQKSE